MRTPERSRSWRGIALLALLGLAALFCERAHAQSSQPARVPRTFVYTTEVDADYLRALLELSGVMTFGFLWYVTQTEIVDDYDVKYSWPVFRRKLSGDAIGLDSNHFGTNFIGHPLGGLGYYFAARHNRLSVAASLGFATSGSLLWEYFGEVRERVSLNDMIVTPLAGLALGESWTQLGAFFDRSSPALHNRILGSTFAPLKAVNDALDGVSPARAKHLDRHGFPADEWHQFDLDTAIATTWQRPTAESRETSVTPEWRLSLVSQLARLPELDQAAQHSLVFDDANVSSIDVEAAIASTGLADLSLTTQVMLFGHSFRDVVRAPNGGLWGHSTLLGFTVGYQYSVHDYDRDRPRPIDKISGVQPLGLLFEHRADLGGARLRSRLEANGSFGGITPYALSAYRLQAPSDVEPSTVLDERNYYFGIGGGVAGTFVVDAGPFEAQSGLRYERFTQVDSDLPAVDQRLKLFMRAGSGIPGTPLRATAFIERRSRAGELDTAHAQRAEISAGLALGARY